MSLPRVDGRGYYDPATGEFIAWPDLDENLETAPLRSTEAAPGETAGAATPEPGASLRPDVRRDAPGDAPGSPVQKERPHSLEIVTLEEFSAVEEPGADALVGGSDEAVIPEGGDVMFYGDGGAGKTTLAVDLSCHLAAGDDWLGLRIGRPVRVLVIENEGPRPLFRAKLRRKLGAWAGSPLEGRVSVFAQPWGKFSFADPFWREQIAAAVRDQELDVLVAGPLSGVGMDEAGTLSEVRDFMALVDDVREQSGRHLVVVLIHHEAKGGKVSGAWEGSGDTLFHVMAQGHGKLRLYFQKTRWSSAHHATTLQLAWADGEGFTVEETPERDDDTIADELLEAVRASGGASWNVIEKKVGGKGERKRAVRDRLLATGGPLIDAGGKGGMKLWHVDDPACPAPQAELRPDRDAPGTHLGEEAS